MTTHRENGVCPHCGREDNVKETHPAASDEARRFECGGCQATWMGVRRQLSQGIKTLRRAYGK